MGEASLHRHFLIELSKYRTPAYGAQPAARLAQRIVVATIPRSTGPFSGDGGKFDKKLVVTLFNNKEGDQCW